MPEIKDELSQLEAEIRDDFDALKAKIMRLDTSRLISSAKTKLDEAWHWVRDHFEAEKKSHED